MPIVPSFCTVMLKWNSIRLATKSMLSAFIGRMDGSSTIGAKLSIASDLMYSLSFESSLRKTLICLKTRALRREMKSAQFLTKFMLFETS